MVICVNAKTHSYDTTAIYNCMASISLCTEPSMGERLNQTHDLKLRDCFQKELVGIPMCTYLVVTASNLIGGTEVKVSLGIIGVIRK